MTYEKRLYSLNLVAFIGIDTGIEPKISKDERSLIYGVYPISDEIQDSINRFYEPHVTVDLHEYLACFKRIKKGL